MPPKPEDLETQAKIKRDPRTSRYVYDYIVELDALVALAADKFKESLIRQSWTDGTPTLTTR